MTFLKPFWQICLGAMLLAGAAQADTPREEFAAARQKWQAAGIHDYSFTFLQSCFCIDRQAIRITVKGDQLHSASNLRDGSAVQTGAVGKPLTMNEIFQQIEAAYARPADHITLSLNPDDGHPERVYIDFVAMMADEELIYEISDFER